MKTFVSIETQSFYATLGRWYNVTGNRPWSIKSCHTFHYEECGTDMSMGYTDIVTDRNEIYIGICVSNSYLP